MDSVRALHYIQSFDSLVSVSEDCTVKVWDVSKFRNQGAYNTDFDPYICLRGHKSPIMSMCGRDNLVISGGSDGSILSWNIPRECDFDDATGDNQY